jgi:flagellar hook-length control protein FliK
MTTNSSGVAQPATVPVSTGVVTPPRTDRAPQSAPGDQQGSSEPQVISSHSSAVISSAVRIVSSPTPSSPQSATPEDAPSGREDSNTPVPSSTPTATIAPNPAASIVPVAETGMAAQTATITATPNAPPQTPAGVPMQDMIDSIRATIEIATRQGSTQARIALQPEELGHISIHLSQTSEGLLARVTADTPAGAQALASSRAELHQSLSSLGGTLLRLDIGSSDTRDREGRFARNAEAASTAGASANSEDEDGDATVEAIDSASQPRGAPRGELLDVFA